MPAALLPAGLVSASLVSASLVSASLISESLLVSLSERANRDDKDGRNDAISKTLDASALSEDAIKQRAQELEAARLPAEERRRTAAKD